MANEEKTLKPFDVQTVGFLNKIDAKQDKNGNTYAIGALAVTKDGPMQGFIAFGALATSMLAMPHKAQVAFGGHLSAEKTVNGRDGEKVVRDLTLRYAKPVAAKTAVAA